MNGKEEFNQQKYFFFAGNYIFQVWTKKKVGADVCWWPPPHSNHTYFFLLLKIERCFENFVILLTWIRPGSGLIKFCGSGYDRSGSTSLFLTLLSVEECNESTLWSFVNYVNLFYALTTLSDENPHFTILGTKMYINPFASLCKPVYTPNLSHFFILSVILKRFDILLNSQVESKTSGCWKLFAEHLTL